LSTDGIVYHVSRSFATKNDCVSSYQQRFPPPLSGRFRPVRRLIGGRGLCLWMSLLAGYTRRQAGPGRSDRTVVGGQPVRPGHRQAIGPVDPRDFLLLGGSKLSGVEKPTRDVSAVDGGLARDRIATTALQRGRSPARRAGPTGQRSGVRSTGRSASAAK
jgi:hypothetical protein